MNLGIIIQARMGSTRLPGKILKAFDEGKSLLMVLIEKLSKVSNAKIIVATSVDPNNDVLEEYLCANGISVFRGSEKDVLERFINAAEAYNIDGIIRICSDNPFIDVDGLRLLSKRARMSSADYIGFKVNETPSILTHFGFWGEFVTLSALKRVYQTTEEDTPAHEHVTFHLYNHPDEYICEWIECPDFIQQRSDIRLTIDTPEDFEMAKNIYADLKEKHNDFSLNDVVEYLDTHREYTAKMKKIIEQNSKKYL